jgi:hypothetical protein
MLGVCGRLRDLRVPPVTGAMVGMKGIGRIPISTTTIWSVLRERALRVWRKWSLYLS